MLLHRSVSGWPGGGPPPLEAVSCWFAHTDFRRGSEFVAVASDQGGEGTAEYVLLCACLND